MPVLKNGRWEKFAQAIAAGQSQLKAHETAGYHPSRGNASRLRDKESISQRIEELMGKSAEQLTASMQAVVYDRERLLDMLQQAYNESIGSERGQSAAVSAVVAMARILGLIIDRREVGEAGAFDAMTDEELVNAAAKKARELGIAGPRLVEDDEEEPEKPIKGVASTD